LRLLFFAGVADVIFGSSATLSRKQPRTSSSHLLHLQPSHSPPRLLTIARRQHRTKPAAAAQTLAPASKRVHICFLPMST
jgi:hypothetical protein